MKICFVVAIVLLSFVLNAQLVVTQMPPKVAAQKAVVELGLKNEFAQKVESARAICFLLDDQGKMVGQSTKWVIGQNKTGLGTKEESKFNFVITGQEAFATTNLTAKVSFTRVVLAGGKLADPKTAVQIQTVK